MTGHRSFMLGLGMVSSAVLLSACMGTRLQLEERKAESFDEVGSVHTAVVSVVPFELMQSKLEPGFELKGDDAFKKALAVTSRTRSSADNATSYLLGIALGAAPVAPAASAASAAGTRPPGATLPPAGAASAPEMAELSGHNAQLVYQLATALKQEVEMLNNYVRDAPRKAGYSPFIVRVQVAVRPRARYTPFDAEVELGFGCKGGSCVSGKAEDKPVVVPLLVTDSMDVGSVSSMQRNLAQIGLAIGAMRGRFGVLSDFGSRSEDLLAGLGWQYDSVMNVARKDEQTLSVRMNAMPTGYARFEMVPRVHNVTVLLLLPDPPRPSDSAAASKGPDAEATRRPRQDMELLPKARFVNAKSGVVFGPEPSRPIATSAFQVSFFGWPRPVASRQYSPIAIVGDQAPYEARLVLRGGANLAGDSYAAALLMLPVGEKPEAAWMHAHSVKVAERSDRRAIELVFQGLTAEAVLALGDTSKAAVICLRHGEDPSNWPVGPKASSCPGTPAPGSEKVEVTGGTYGKTLPVDKPVGTLKLSKALAVDRRGDGRLALELSYDDKLVKVPTLRLTLEGGLLGSDLRHVGRDGCAVFTATGLDVSGPCRFEVAVRGVKVPVAADDKPLRVKAVEVTGEKKVAHDDYVVPVVAAKPPRPAAPAAAAAGKAPPAKPS